MAKKPAKLDTRTARLKLPVRKKPYPLSLSRGETLLYRRCKGPGTWGIKGADGRGSNWVKTFATADDNENADGEHILSFEQAVEFARSLARGQDVDSKGADSGRPGTLAEAVNDYQRDLVVRGAAVVNAQRLRRLLPPTLLTKPVALLTTKELRRFRDGLAERMKRSSVNRSCKPLAAALNLAADHDRRIANRDAWRIGLAAFKDTHEPNNVVLADDEIRSLVAASYETDEALGLLVEVLAVTGARISQAARLTVGDIVANGHDALTMPSAKKGKGEKKVSRVKVPIPAALAARLRLTTAGRPASAPLLLRSDGQPWEPSKSDHRLPFAAAVTKAGLDPKRVATYALRHSSITRSLLRGLPARLVARLHDTSIPMLEKTYSAHIADHGDEAARAVLLDLDPPAGGNVVPLGAAVMIDDTSWAKIEVAALPHRPNDAARAALDAALADFAGLQKHGPEAIDPEAIRRERGRWARIVESLAPLHSELQRLYLDVVEGKPALDPPEQSSLLGLLFALEAFAVRATTSMRGLAVWAEAYRRQQNPAREWLYWRLFEIWTRDFGGELTVSTVDEPGGPLVRFLQATTPLALGILPSPHTFKDAVTREQKRRAPPAG